MSNQDLTPDCGRIRNELSAYLYGELAAEGTTALEQHLATCAACRDELAALRETRTLLERWETPRSVEDPYQLARSIAELARAEERSSPHVRRGRLVRWSAILSGAAAALVFSLSVLSTQAAFADGAFQISFHLPGTAPTASGSSWDERMRAIAAQEVSTRSVSLQRDQQELLQRFSQMTREEMQQELLRMTQALDVVLAQKEHAWDTRLTHFGQEAARADLEQRRVISNLAALVVPR